MHSSLPDFHAVHADYSTASKSIMGDTFKPINYNGIANRSRIHRLRAYWLEVHAKRAARKNTREQTNMMLEKKAKDDGDESTDGGEQAKEVEVKDK